MPAQFTNIPYPAADADAANKKYVDDQTGGGGGGGGIPAGGTTGQQLTKVSGADFDVDWEAAGGTGGGAGIPVGGSTGQQLTKDSSADFDVSWQAAGGGGGGGGVWNGVNHQTGTSYFVVVGDDSKLVTLNNASPVSVILPPPGDFEVVDGFDVDHSSYVYLSYFTPSVGPPIGGLSGYGGLSQSFTPSASAFLTKASFSIRKHGSPTGTAVAKLYTHSGTYGSTSVPGTLLATSDTLDVSTVSATGGFVNLLFSTPYSMVSGTPYVISIESTAGDSSNYLEIPLAIGTYGGTWAAFGDGVWSPHGAGGFSSYDLIFAVYTGGSGIGDTWVAYFENLGAGPVTISAPFSAIDDIYSVGLQQDTGIIIACDGSSYYTCRGVGNGRRTTNANAPNSIIPINVLTGAAANIVSKNITYRAGDHVTIRIWGATVNDSGSTRHYSWRFNLGSLSADIDLGDTQSGGSPAERANHYAEVTFSVASSSSAWLLARTIGAHQQALGQELPINTAVSYMLNQHSTSNLTGAQTTSVQMFSDGATATQSFELHAWTIEKIPSNP